MTLSVIRVPEGKDPDECIQKNPAAWQRAVENPISVMDFYFDYAAKKFETQSVQGKRQTLDFLLPFIKTAKSEMEQNIYINRLSLNLQTDPKLLWNDLRNLKSRKIATPQATAVSETKMAGQFSREEYLLGFIFSYPESYPEVANRLIDSVPMDPNTERFYIALKTVYTRESLIDLAHLKEAIPEEDREKIEVLSLLVEEEYPDFTDETKTREVRKLIHEINRKNLYNTQKEVEYKIRLTQDPIEKKTLLGRYNEILKLAVKL